MRIAFVRTGESHDRIHVTLDDGGELTWLWPAGGPPHDLLHLVVERELGLRGGFWGLIESGAGRGLVDAHARRADEAPGLTPEQNRSLDQAEAAVNAVTMAISVDGLGAREAMAQGREFAGSAGAEFPDVGLERFQGLCRSASVYVQRWRETAPGETLVEGFP